MGTNVLERMVLEWFARHSESEQLAAQCRSARVLGREHTGAGLTVSLATSASAAAQFPTRCVPNAPLISSPELPHGGSVDLWLESGVISELEFVALGGASFPLSNFEFDLVNELPGAAHAS